jgi:hypothetical protein
MKREQNTGDDEQCRWKGKQSRRAGTHGRNPASTTESAG